MEQKSENSNETISKEIIKILNEDELNLNFLLHQKYLETQEGKALQLENVYINMVNMPGKNLNFSSLEKVNISNSIFSGLIAIDSKFVMVKFNNVTLCGSNFENTVFEHCNFSESKLNGCNFKDCVFIDCELTENNISGSSFYGASLVDCDFYLSKLDGVEFKKADITNCNFDKTIFENSEINNK